MPEQSPRSFASFISYSHADKKIAKWLHRALENYRVPRKLRAKISRINPVYRDDEENAASDDLGKTISTALANSESLIVICSPKSANSKWVDKEIREFKALRNKTKVYGLIIDGTPFDQENECFPESLKSEVASDGTLTATPVEPLAIDIRVHGRRDALLKLAASILGVHYDELKRRDHNRTVQIRFMITGLTFSIFSIYAGSLFLQTRAVNTQFSSILSSIAHNSTDSSLHGRAMRLGILSARSSIFFPPAPEAEPILARAAHNSTLEGMLEGHQFPIYSASFDSTGLRLVTGSQDKTVRVWRINDLGNWTEEHPPIDVGVMVRDARFAENGNAIIVRPLDLEKIRTWRKKGTGWIYDEPFGEPNSYIRSFNTNLDGTSVVIGYQNSDFEFWKFARNGWHKIANLNLDNKIPVSTAITSSGEWIAIGLIDGMLQLWRRANTNSWKLEQDIPDFQVETRQLEFAKSGKRLLAVGIGGDLRVLDKNSSEIWKQVGRISADQQTSNASLLPPDGQFIVTNGRTAIAKIYIQGPNEDWLEVERFGYNFGIDSFSRVLKFSNEGSRFVSAGNDGIARVWSPADFGSWATYAKLKRKIGLVDQVNQFVKSHTSFKENEINSSDDRRFATTNVYGEVTIRDKPTGLEIGVMNVSSQPEFSIEFGGNDETLVVRNTSTGTISKTASTRFLVSLKGKQLIESVCKEKLFGSMSVLTKDDIVAAPILRGREGENVCAHRPLKQILKNWAASLLEITS